MFTPERVAKFYDLFEPEVAEYDLLPAGCTTLMRRAYASSSILLLLLQSALQPLWVLACSTIVEYSQQEGFYRVPLPVARQTPNLEDQ